MNDLSILNQAYGGAGSVLIIAGIVLGLLSLRDSFSSRSTRWHRVMIATACIAIAAIPIQGLGVFEYIRGLAGDLSIPTTLLLGAYVAERIANKPLCDTRNRSVILFASWTGGLAIYPSSLGFLPADIYHFGYRPVILLFLLLGLAILSWISSLRFTAFIIIFAVIAFDVQLMESTNLCDYLIDPFIVMAAFFWIIYRIIRRFRFPARNGSVQPCC